MGLVLSVEGIEVERGGHPVLSGLSFALRGGEALAVTGPNGAGKSTLLRAVAGFIVPKTGNIVLEPPDPGDEEAPLPERAHYLGHGDALKSALSPIENLRFAAALAGRPRLGPAEALDRLGLLHAADLPCAYLSAGQRRRVALARLLVAFRPLWLLDEPTTALDRASGETFAEIMREHLSDGGLILAATHFPLGLRGMRELRLGEA